jgi:signal transduction histidine kinase
MANSNLAIGLTPKPVSGQSRKLFLFGALLVTGLVLVLVALLSTSWMQVAIITIPIALIVFIAISQVLGKVIEPLSDLQEQTKRIASGDFSRSISVSGIHEISEIAQAVNTLLREVREANERVTELPKLEQSVLKYRATADELKLSYDHLIVVSELGQQIIASLNLDDIASTLYETLNTMMDASLLEVGILRESEGALRVLLSIDHHQTRTPYEISVTEPNTFAGWVLHHGREVLLNDAPQHYARYISAFDPHFSGEHKIESLICLPLTTKGRVAGVLTIGSYRKNAYTNYHLDMVKSLALYASVALDNANAYQKLDKAMNELKMAQRQLVQSEKMSSLGLLTAGIAHEINNPINFVSANVNPLRRNLDDVLKILGSYQALASSQNMQEALAKIHQEEKHLDLAVSVEEIGKLLDGIQEGATRTAEIVQGLRNFSRTDEQALKLADLNQGLDSTLMLLHNKYKERIEIEKDYGNLPEIECFPGQLNQVFMNILSNAVQAIHEKGSVYIKTRQRGEQVEVRIKDTGMGMPEDVRKHIFDPFFTTKDVGVGTGLGLSISYGIIEKHNGTIEVESSPGIGTEFIITLPIHQSEMNDALEAAAAVN